MTITNNMAGRLPVVAVHADRAVPGGLRPVVRGAWISIEYNII